MTSSLLSISGTRGGRFNSSAGNVNDVDDREGFADADAGVDGGAVDGRDEKGGAHGVRRLFVRE